MKATVEMTRGGKTTTVLPTEDFKSGDKVRLIFSTNKDGHIYWLAKGTSGQYQVLFPSVKAGMDNTMFKNREYTVPAKGAWKFDDNKGTETLVAVLSPNPVPDLDKAVKLAGEGDRQEASSIISGVVNGHEKSAPHATLFLRKKTKTMSIPNPKNPMGKSLLSLPTN